MKDGKYRIAPAAGIAWISAYFGVFSGTELKLSKFWFLSIPLLLAGLCQAWTKEEVYKKLAATQGHTNIAYKANIETTMKVGNMAAQSDTGTVVFSPPNCFKMTMRKAGTENSGCGDTTWLKTKDGNVTRSVGKGGAGAAPSSPNLKEMLQSMDFQILGEKPDQHLEVEATLRQEGMSVKARMILDTRKWLLKKMSFPTPQGETIEIGYNYMQLAGEDLLCEINTVIGSSGFIRMKFADIKKIAPIPKKDFEGF